MYALTELDDFATVIASVLALITVFVPLLNRIRRLHKIQFGYPGVLNFLTEITTIMIFLSVIYYKDWVHLLPPFFLWVAIGVVGVLVMMGLADHVSSKTDSFPATWFVVAGGALYVASIGFLWLGIVQASAELAVFRHLEGDVTTKDGKGVEGHRVILSVGSATRLLRTRTDIRGHYRFLLTKEEYNEADEIQFQKYHPANPSSIVLAGANRCVSAKRACYVPIFVLQ